MATRSFIAKKTKTGYKGIYCHHDGYPSGVGATLKMHYTNPKKVDQLLKLGDISSLRRYPGEKHDFDMDLDLLEVRGWTTAYGRDRGEKGTRAKTVKTFDALERLADRMGTEYLYVFTDGKWQTHKI